ncbi:MAG: hypothetical protein WD294_11265 [Phycisphaeraceae bacterium]
MRPMDIRELTEADVPEVAQFIATSAAQLRREQGASEPPARMGETEQAKALRSQLFESPFAEPGIGPGLVLRNRAGAVTGSLLFYPWRYLAEKERLLGLAAGAFFVDRSERMAGFFLFRKYLNMKGPDFCYANSCNPNLASLWWKMKGCAVVDSEYEHFFVLRPEPVVQEMLLRKRVPTPAARVMSAITAPGRRLLAPRRTGWRVERCTDYARLAESAERHRREDLITTERSEAYLRWRYPARDPDTKICRFTTPRGDEGWFSIATQRRGMRDQIRGVRLLDAVWPQERVSCRMVFNAVLEEIDGEADVLSVRGRPIFDELRQAATYTRRLSSPESFVGSKQMNPISIASRLDCANADLV